MFKVEKQNKSDETKFQEANHFLKLKMAIFKALMPQFVTSSLYKKDEIVSEYALFYEKFYSFIEGVGLAIIFAGENTVLFGASIYTLGRLINLLNEFTAPRIPNSTKNS